MENKEIKQARKVLEEISQDERERRLTELREKYIMDQYDTRLSGYDEGSANKQREIAKNLLELGLTVEQIIKATELTKEEIEEIKRNNN